MRRLDLIRPGRVFLARVERALPAAVIVGVSLAAGLLAGAGMPRPLEVELMASTLIAAAGLVLTRVPSLTWLRGFEGALGVAAVTTAVSTMAEVMGDAIVAGRTIPWIAAGALGLTFVAASGLTPGRSRIRVRGERAAVLNGHARLNGHAGPPRAPSLTPLAALCTVGGAGVSSVGLALSALAVERRLGSPDVAGSGEIAWFGLAAVAASAAVVAVAASLNLGLAADPDLAPWWRTLTLPAAAMLSSFAAVAVWIAEVISPPVQIDWLPWVCLAAAVLDFAADQLSGHRLPGARRRPVAGPEPGPDGAGRTEGRGDLTFEVAL